MKKTICLTGGGTAGHIMPNIALIPLLKKKFDTIYYFGSSGSMEEKLIKEIEGVTFISIPTTKLIRKFTIKNLAIPFKLIKSVNITKKILKKIKPDVIFCKGGFVSVPVAIAGKKCKIPVVSHESDYSMGLANKIILKFANTVCTSFEDTALISKKCVCTGSPIREQVFKGKKENVLKMFNYNPSKPTVLFFGGSLGSVNINNLVKDSLSTLTKKYNVLHITGKNNAFNTKFNNYYQVEFAGNIEDFFAASDVVVCRGGANSLFEMVALKKPTLIIPLSKAQSRGDQIENAEYFKKHNFADVMYEEEMSPALLAQKLDDLFKNRDKIIFSLQKNKNSNAEIVKIILSSCKNDKK